MKLAKKINKYVIEPKSDGFSEEWESFHATNPSAIRLSGYDGVFLAYRAGGSKDKYYVPDLYVWGSSMGLAILDDRGEEVVYRFPLPIFKILKHPKYPQSRIEFDEFQKVYSEELVVFHDFRLFCDNGYLYVLTHDGTLTKCFDSIYRIKTASFLDKVEQSKRLIETNCVTRENWAKIWYNDTVFEPCGVDNTSRFYASAVNKNDIVILKLENGKTQICHRVLPDYAVIETENQFYLEATPDGITKYGHLENCVRPGYYDNSHVGNNGNPIPMTINGTRFFMDVVHGVNNHSLSVEYAEKNWDLSYVPYLRIKDAYDGQTVYYSDDPILVLDDVWKEYAEEGAWISKLNHLRGVMFAGGQIAADKNKITESDRFVFYTGVGDTAVARAEFVPSEIIDSFALCDLQSYQKIKTFRKSLKQKHIKTKLNKLGKWQFYLINREGRLAILRELISDSGEIAESGVRLIQLNAGYFDFAGAESDGTVYQSEYGFLVPYKGYSFLEGKAREGNGVIILKHDNPEKLYYRSVSDIGNDLSFEKLLQSIPDKVKFEILKTEEFIKTGKTFESDLTKWLLNKSEGLK